MTTPEQYVVELRRRLPSAYTVEEKDFAGRRVFVAHRSDFRLRWGAVRLLTTVTVVPFEPEVDLTTLEEYLAASGRAARAEQGRIPLGFQVGAAAVPIAVLPAVTPAAREWASRAHGHKFAQVSYPVAVGLSPDEVVQPERMRIGRVFAGFLRDVVSELLPHGQ